MAALVSAGCVGGEGWDLPSSPIFKDVPCPQVVANRFVDPSKPTCGFLTVPEDRSNVESRSIDLFVVRVLPTTGTPAPDPLFVTIHIGQSADWGATEGLADLVNREVIAFDQRGVGLSRPNLACPEVEAAAPRLLEVRMSDPAHRQIVVEAVTACRDRLTRRGIDLSAYDLEAMAADVEDLRRALGIREWNLYSQGTATRIILEVMRRYPQHIRTVVLDSPEFPHVDPLVEAIRGTGAALAMTARLCRADHPKLTRLPSPCATSYPHLMRSFGAATRRLDALPIRYRAFTETGQPVDGVFDGGMLVRLLRFYHQDGLHGFTWNTPNVIADASEGVLGVGPDVVLDDALCDGYDQSCNAQDEEGRFFLAHGTRYSVTCRDILPFADRQAAAAAAGGDPGFLDAFVEHNPLFDVCDAWGVDQGDASLHQVVTSDIPTLVFEGMWSSHATPRAFSTAMRSLPNGILVRFPTATTFVIANSDCAKSIRGAFLDSPTERPDTSCSSRFIGPELLARWDPVPRPAPGELPSGTFRLRIRERDGRSHGLSRSVAMLAAGRYRLELDHGRWALHLGDGRQLQGFRGTYSVRGARVLFFAERPHLYDGWSWRARWRWDGNSLAFTRTEMTSDWDFAWSRSWDLAMATTWMESRSWTLVSP